MKKAIILSLLLLIISCSDDDDPIQSPTTMERTNVTLSISQIEGYSLPSCPDAGDTSFLIKDNSLISGALGRHGAIADSNDNIVSVFSCTQSSNGNADFFVQRFGGILNTTDNSTFSFEGRLDINRATQEVSGYIEIRQEKSNLSENFYVSGKIDASGSCTIQGRSY